MQKHSELVEIRSGECTTKLEMSAWLIRAVEDWPLMHGAQMHQTNHLTRARPLGQARFSTNSTSAGSV